MSDINEENVHPIIREPFKITKALFSLPEDFHYDEFVSEVRDYIDTGRINIETFSNILNVFSIVRPKQQALITKLENAFPTTHRPLSFFYKEMLRDKLPFIFDLDTTQLPLLEFIKNDDFSSLQEFISNTIDFNFEQTYEIYNSNINLIDIATYYGSINCFKYLVLNNAPFSKNVCPFSICGGNYEIIHYLENNFPKQNFGHEICLIMSILYHQYEVTDYLNANYNSEITNKEATIISFNYYVFSTFFIQAKYFTLKEGPDARDEYGRTALHVACSCENLPIIKYLCEVAKANTELCDNRGCTAFYKACTSENLPIVKYLCEEAKVNTEAANEDGITALQIACFCGCLPIVKYLCEVARVNTETRASKGYTAIHLACESGNFPIIKYLCEVAKVNIEVINEYGKTPFDTAASLFGRQEIMDYLAKRRKSLN